VTTQCGDPRLCPLGEAVDSDLQVGESGAGMVVGPRMLQHFCRFLYRDRFLPLLIAVRGPRCNERRNSENI